MTAAAPPLAVAGSTIPADRAQSLHRWNVVLAVLHALQAGLIIVLSFASDPLVTRTVTGSFLQYDQATETLFNAQRSLFELPLGLAVALFFLLSALAHIAVAFPFRSWYERSLARGQNPARWIEYALSASVMIVIIAMLTGIQDAGAPGSVAPVQSASAITIQGTTPAMQPKM